MHDAAFIDILVKALVIRINIPNERSRHSRVGVSRVIYAGHCRISKFGCRGCTVGLFFTILFYQVRFTVASPLLLNDRDRVLVRGHMGQYGFLSPSLVTYVS